MPLTSGITYYIRIAAFGASSTIGNGNFIINLKYNEQLGEAKDMLDGLKVDAFQGAFVAYSYAPGQRIYNAFFQSIIGLHDFATFANDPLGRRLWLQGERQARVEVRRSNSGSWSWYQPGVPSDLGYHKVLRDFVTGLCDRLNNDRQRETIELRDRTGDPGAVLRSLDRWPDSGPFCETAQQMNRQLWKRLRAMGLPTPFG